MLSNLKYRDLSVVSLRKQPTFGDATTGFSAKWRRLRNERRNSILMTRHYPVRQKCRLFSQTSRWWAGQLFVEGEKMTVLDLVELGFRILVDSWIPDFKAQHFRVPQTKASRIAYSASKNFLDFGIRITLHVATGGTRHRNAGFALAT